MARYEFKCRVADGQEYVIFQMEFEQSRIEELRKQYGNEIEEALKDIARKHLKVVWSELPDVEVSDVRRVG